MDTAKFHIYAPDPEDCLLLHYESSGIVKLDQVVCQVKGDEGITYLEGDFQLEMNEEVYHQCVMQLRRVTTTRPSPAQKEPASGGHTSRGRPLRLPHRLREQLLQNHKTKGKEKRQTKQTIKQNALHCYQSQVAQKEKMMNRLQINS